MDLSKLTLGDKIIAGAGIVLIINLLFLPWHSFDFGPISASASGIESPNGFWGILALLLTIALVAVILISKLTTTKLPDIPIPWPNAIFFAGIAVFVLLLLKLVIETDSLGFGAFLGILLAAGIAYGGYLKRNEPAQASF